LLTQPIDQIVLCLVQAVLKIVSGLVKEDVLPLLCKIIALLGDLLCLILDLVGELLSAVLKIVVSLLGDLLPLTIEIDISVITKALCL